MGNRLSQIATRTGDNGTTGLGDNTRVSKNSLRVHAMGDVDELNSHIGLLLCEDMPEPVRTLLVEIQHQLFNLGGELSIPGYELLKPEAVLALDEALAEHNEQLPRLQEFILPAGTRAASLAHVCRTVARRAERVQPSAIREFLALAGQPGITSFAGGYPDPTLFPMRELHGIYDALLTDGNASALQYTASEGLPELRVDGNGEPHAPLGRLDLVAVLKAVLHERDIIKVDPDIAGCHLVEERRPRNIGWLVDGADLRCVPGRRHHSWCHLPHERRGADHQLYRRCPRPAGCGADHRYRSRYRGGDGQRHDHSHHFA